MTVLASARDKCYSAAKAIEFAESDSCSDASDSSADDEELSESEASFDEDELSDSAGITGKMDVDRGGDDTSNSNAPCEEPCHSSDDDADEDDDSRDDGTLNDQLWNGNSDTETRMVKKLCFDAYAQCVSATQSCALYISREDSENPLDAQPVLDATKENVTNARLSLQQATDRMPGHVQTVIKVCIVLLRHFLSYFLQPYAVVLNIQKFFSDKRMPHPSAFPDSTRAREKGRGASARHGRESCVW